MERTRFSIMMDFRRELQRAEKLNTLASSVGECSDKMEEIEQHLRRAWSSDSSEAFFKKMHYSGDSIDNIRNNLVRASETVKQIATRTYESEMRSLDIATKRTYK